MLRWKDSASIILTANIKENVTKTGFDYKILTMKRHKNSSFLPGNHVFPGGTVDSSDLDLKWKSLFKKYGFDDSHFLSLYPQLNKKRPIIFKIDSDNPYQLPKEVSLRITAIREIFEECGILLCKPLTEKKFSKWINYFSLNKPSLKEWQNKVHENSTEFYNMCNTFDCYPDLWALYEWGNWLTPTALEGKRFNAIFFMACMRNLPPCEPEISEVEELSWNFPTDFTESSAKFKLATPQIYEISKISKFHSLDRLLDSAIDKNKSGVEFRLPVVVKLSDGVVFLLSGDSEYPINVSLTSVQRFEFSDMSINQYRNKSGAKRRIEFSKDKMTPCKIIDNF